MSDLVMIAFPTEAKAEEVRPGAFWGSLIGLIFLMPLAGAALGAASRHAQPIFGGCRHQRPMDEGDRCRRSTRNRSALRTGGKVTADKVLDRLKGEGGTALKTSLDHTKEAALQAALAEVKAAAPPFAS